MKLKIHTRFYNWSHIRECWADTKYADSSYYPRIAIIFANGDERTFVFDGQEDKKENHQDALQVGRNILNAAIAEMS